MNFSLWNTEIWGPKARVDNLSDFFSMKLVDHGLLDIEPTKLLPTWSNRRSGLDRICKRKDRFLVSEDLMEKNFRFRQGVGHGRYSDHYLVMLLIKNGEWKPHCLFKFNANWLNDESFVPLLKDSWKVNEDDSLVFPSTHFADNLKYIKDVSIRWFV